eukprot:TRINITY_DN4410_c0_g1_i1.p2 TRINITY_DN4410_c0_g1~~TRINITY_DN4410_c0_g1_i1.p2  ORF type:complete len:138 (-),score=4.97 TRINITY_DN4410_c0_g1_i1:175-588(-)
MACSDAVRCVCEALVALLSSDSLGTTSLVDISASILAATNASHSPHELVADLRTGLVSTATAEAAAQVRDIDNCDSNDVGDTFRFAAAACRLMSRWYGFERAYIGDHIMIPNQSQHNTRNADREHISTPRPHKDHYP